MNDIEEVYEAHSGTVYRYLLSLCRSPNLAEELTQETFYRALRSLHTYHGGCKISVWLCQIAKHLWYQELDRQRRQATLELDENLDAAPEASSAPDEDLRGEQIMVGQVITLYEAPKSVVHESARYTLGYSYDHRDGGPPEDFDYTFTVRYRDTETVYSMREEGLFEQR